MKAGNRELWKDYIMKRLKILLYLSMVALLFACQGPKDLGQKETAISPGVNTEMIQKEIPDFTNADGFLISGRLSDEVAKVQDLAGKEGAELKTLKEKIFKEQGDEIFKGYEFSKEEEDLIARESYLTYVVGDTYYDENGHKKLDPSQEDFKEAQEQEAENKAKDQAGFHGNAEVDVAAIHKDLPEFSEDEAFALTMRLNDYLEARKDVQGLQGKDLSAFREDLVREKKDDLAKGFNYFSEDQINLILSHIRLGYQVDGKEYTE